MAARISKGCLRCRTRRVKCDETHPACNRCIQRNEVCTGYRDDTSLIFRDENEKAARRSKLRRADSLQELSRSGSSSKSSSTSRHSNGSSSLPDDPSDLSALELSGLHISTPFPWAKRVPDANEPSVEEQAVSRFFEKYVMYPCNESSSPGFLEQLPNIYHDVKIDNKPALRWAVRAAAYANISSEHSNVVLGNKALQCYGMALKGLSDALIDTTETPDDFVLMTVVVLDLFEAVFVQDKVAMGCHAQGMAQILRLRGADQVYGARGWSLFRLSHHRLQRQQLIARQPLMPESDAWLDSLNEDLPYVGVERENFEINKTCERARSLLASIKKADVSIWQMLEMVREMHEVDRIGATWRDTQEWAYKTVKRSETGLGKEKAPQVPDFIQLHRDVWIAYEWNYNRTARILMHEQLLRCIDQCQPLSCPDDLAREMLAIIQFSTVTVRELVDEVLATVPQSLGDVDHEGKIPDSATASPKCQGVGAYFLLWPIKVSKSTRSATQAQRDAAQLVFERIRECTGMKSALGKASSI